MTDTKTTAETAYFAADEAAGQIIDRLTAPAPAAARAGLLRELADLEDTMSRACVIAWPGDETPDDDGFTPSQSMRLGAQAVRLIADAEDPAIIKAAPGEWADAAGPILDQLDGSSTARQRADLLAGLYTAVEPLIGGQAAETIETIRRAYADAAKRLDEVRDAVASGSKED